MRWAAAIRKWPLPQAGSHTFRSRMARFAARLARCLVQHRVEALIEQGVDQRGRRVVAAGGLALVAAGRRQLEGPRPGR